MLTVEGYQIRRSLGVGATSEVFEAIREIDQKHIALKVFSPIVTADASVVERLQNEADVLLKLQHPNVVLLHSTVKSAKHFCLDLELVVGQDLRRWSQSYTLPLIEPSLWVLAQIARGLGAAHEIGVIHRDLKPENVLISDAGDVKITDFGLARQINRLTITRMGLLIGSLGYIAPEVIDGDRVSEQSDIFSFGVIAYELLAKRAPFAAETPQGIIKSVMDGTFTPLSAVNAAIPPRIAELIEKCLAKNPESRPRSIWEVEAVLMTYLGTSGVRTSCRDLVSSQKRDTSAPHALLQKHETLWSAINSANAQTSIVPLVLETMSLFPDDSKATDLLRDLSQKNNRNNQKRVALWSALTILLLAVGVGAFQLYAARAKPAIHAADRAPEATDFLDAISAKNSVTPEPSLTPADSAQENANSVAKKESVVSIVGAVEKSPSSSATRREKSRPAVETYGYLSFVLPEGVNVEVDGLLVPASSLLKYQVATGTHSVKMVKEGFLPIESRVSVRAGQIAKINALGAPPKTPPAEEEENE